MADVKQALTKLLREMEAEDEIEERSALVARIEALEARGEAGAQITTAQIIAALEAASDDELEALHGTVVDRLAREVEERREAAANEEPPPVEEPPPPAKAKTRPGRRQGQAYNWWVDEDGNVVQLDVARIYNEPDEPDEVELPGEEAAA